MSKDPPIIRLAIAIPAYGGNVTMHHTRMFLELGNTLGASGERFQLVSFTTFDVNGIDQCRNLALQQAFSVQADWLLMIDADTWVEPSAIDRQGGTDAGFLLLRMISEAARKGAAAVVAPVMNRTMTGTEGGLMVYDVKTTIVEETVADLPGYPGECYEEANWDDGKSEYSKLTFDDAPRGLVEIDSAATAVFALDLAFAAQHFLLFKFEGKLSEDAYYCRAIAQAGGKLYADTRVRTAHLSRTTPLYSMED